MAAQLSHMLRKNNPVLRQQPTNLVDQLCAAAAQPRPHPVPAQQTRLPDPLGRDEPQARRCSESAGDCRGPLKI